MSALADGAGNPATHALVLVKGPRYNPSVAALVAVARAANVLIVHVELSPADLLPWAHGNTPGEPDGNALVPGASPKEVYVRSDARGVFFATTIDLVLRANGVRSIFLDGDVPADFADCIAHFATHHGYPFTGLDPCTREAIHAIWSAACSVASDGTGEHAEAQVLGTLADRIDPGHAALILIDVQNDFCDPRGAVGWLGDSITMIGAAVDRIKALLAAAREAGLFIVHVRAEYGMLYRNAGSPYRFPASGEREPAVWTASAADLSAPARFAPEAVEVCLPGSWGGRFVDGIVPQPGEAVITKHRYSAFVETGLDLMLRARGVRTVVLAGVTTNCCVESTARDAAMRDFYLVVAEDCVAVKDKLADLHRASLESIRLYFGLVRPSEHLRAAWRTVTTPSAARAGARAD